jgi:hypothetical protein
MAPLASRLTLVASVLCIVAAVVALYARSAILDDAQFADRAVGALAQDEVAEEIAQRFTDGVLERSPGLVTLRPAIDEAAESVVTGPVFAAQFGVGMRALHRGVFSGGARPSLQVPGMAAQVQAALAASTPVLATRLPRSADPSLMSIGGNARERVLLRVARRAEGLAWAAPFVLALGLLGLLLVALTAPDRRRGLWASGLALGAAGGALAVAWIAARTLTLEGFDTGWGDAVVNTIWGAYLDDLRVWSFGLAGAGILVAAAARPDRVPRPAVPGALRGAGLVAAGAVLLADRDLAFDIAATTGAGVLLYLGACRLLAGRDRIVRAGAALAVLTAVVVLAAGRPPHTPQPVARADAAVRASAAAHRARPSTASVARKPRICFASAGDARVAAQRAAIPEGAVVKQFADGRVCVRER